MTKANQRQVGGTHYKTEYEHWDFAIWCDMGPMEYAASKHVTRWRKKDGIKDLKKAMHYIDKLVESYDIYDLHYTHTSQAREKVREETHKFAVANDLTELEEKFIYWLVTFESREELDDVRGTLVWLTHHEMEGMGGTPGDGGHYENE